MRAALLAVACLLLAGCSGAPASEPAPAAPAATAGAAPSAAAAPPPPPAVHAAACEETTGLSYGVPGMGGGSAEPATCPFAEARAGDLTGLQGGVVEAAWAAGPTVLGGNLFLQSDSCRSGLTVDTGGLHQETCQIAQVQGPSPLRIELGADVLASHGADNLTAYVIFNGATTAQAVAMYVTLFEAMPPSGYSALPA